MNAKITLILHYEGKFTTYEADGNVEYVGGEFDVWEDLFIYYMNTFVLWDMVQACKNYSNIGGWFWLTNKDLDFNHGLHNYSIYGVILYLVKDAMENDNEINVSFHHEVDPIFAVNIR